MLNEDDLAAHAFPYQLAPVVQHKLMQRQDAETISRVLVNHLYRYLDFTYRLETVVVNDVVRDIALGHTVFTPSLEVRHDAFKIYCDEAYHALFSFDLLKQMYELSGQEPILPKTPAFLSRLNKMLETARNERERHIIKLFFVIVSETLITSSLSMIKRDKSIPEAIRMTIADHADDEGRHHAFFAGLLFSIMPELKAEDRVFALRKVPDFIMAFVEPDTEVIRHEIAASGMKTSDADQVVKETYTDKVKKEYALKCGQKMLAYASKIEEFERKEVREIFEERLGI